MTSLVKIKKGFSFFLYIQWYNFFKIFFKNIINIKTLYLMLTIFHEFTRQAKTWPITHPRAKVFSKPVTFVHPWRHDNIHKVWDYVPELITYDYQPTQVGGWLVAPTTRHPLSTSWLSCPYFSCNMHKYFTSMWTSHNLWTILYAWCGPW